MPPSNRPETPPTMWGAMLKHYREQSGLSQEQLAQRINYSSAQIASVETGRRKPSEELAHLCDETTTAGGALALLFEMFLGHSGFKPGFQEWTELERDATMIRGWESRWVPGLLQTSDYMEIVLDPEGPRAVAVRRAPADPRQGATASRALRDRRVRATAPGIGGGFALANVNGRTVGYEESTTHSTVLTEKHDLHQLEVIYDRLLGEADPPARSLERIQRVRHELWTS